MYNTAIKKRWNTLENEKYAGVTQNNKTVSLSSVEVSTETGGFAGYENGRRIVRI